MFSKSRQTPHSEMMLSTWNCHWDTIWVFVFEKNWWKLLGSVCRKGLKKTLFCKCGGNYNSRGGVTFAASTFSQIRRKKIHLELEANDKTSENKSPLPPRLLCLPQETAASQIDSQWIRIKQAQWQKFKYRILQECWGDSAPSQIKEYAKGDKGREKRARGNERSAGENNRKSLLIFHLVPVSLLFNNFPYGRFTLTKKRRRKLSQCNIYSSSFAIWRLDFSVSARPLTCPSRTVFSPHECNIFFPMDGDRKITTARVAGAAERRQSMFSVSGGILRPRRDLELHKYCQLVLGSARKAMLTIRP